MLMLLDAGKADGSIRSDVDARDVILLIGYLSRVDEPGPTPAPGIRSASSSTDYATADNRPVPAGGTATEASHRAGAPPASCAGGSIAVTPAR